MTVLQEILEWSKDRPDWQRDALRRLALNGDLSVDDIRSLVEICKGAHGLAETQVVIPLTLNHVHTNGDESAPVSLVSIFHNRGVNALAANQTLEIKPNLTLVYGDNAAGKTGYIRILKSACHARGQENILGNVVSGNPPLKPVVAIKYKVGVEGDTREWDAQAEDEFISRVSVFDTHCAAVYLTEKTEVAFRPFGLDLFDKLVKACKDVRAVIEKEQRSLASNALDTVKAQIPKSTTSAKLLENITSLTKIETVHGLSRLSLEEEIHLELLEKSLLDLQANDPEKLIRRLNIFTGRVQALDRHIKAVESTLSVEAVNAVFNARTEYRRKQEEAKRLREVTLPAGILAGTGSESWTELWESARQFSQGLAYLDQSFPVVEEGASCVLCQQDLNHAARHRLQKFESFVKSTTEQELRLAKGTFAQLQKTFADLKVKTDSIEETIEEIRIYQETLTDAIVTALTTAEDRRKAILLALSDDQDQELAGDCPALISVTGKVNNLAMQINERVKTLRNSATAEKRNRMAMEVQELHARTQLGQYEQIVLDEIERKKKFAAYSLCIGDTKTQAITKKSSAVTREAVTQKLNSSFQDELAKLSFQHVEVELKEVGGKEGVLYHKLVLTRAPGVKLQEVVSEGEQRCLSIAAFFAELSTTDDTSGIVFDDPVSSLDYKWREGVARRLVNEAKIRQVVVFTHDVVFLLLLKQVATEVGVSQHDQHVRQLPHGAGVCAEELPWVALKVSKRIAYLRELLQDVRKSHRDGNQKTYELQAGVIYGYLREAWERGVEEVLLKGIVERYRPSIQTLQVMSIASITEEDCKAVEIAMTKCSKWLLGHDQAPAARADIPEPSVIEQDIEELDSWRKAILNR